MNFRETVLQAIGDFPQKPDLNIEIERIEEKDGYTLQTVKYNVEKSERIKAYLLIPKNLKEKNPAIIGLHQHNLEYNLGKSEVIGAAGNPMFAYGLELCLRGYVVIVPDQLCFEERIKLPPQQRVDDLRKNEIYESVRLIHSGSCLRAKYLHDMSIALDILETLPFVDDTRIGAIGHSLGAQEAAWLMWYDKRIATAVCSCGIGETNEILHSNNIFSLALWIPGFAKLGDTSDIICEIAPRPLFMTSGSEDPLYKIDIVKPIIDKTNERYANLGKPENYRAIIFKGAHVFEESEKREAYTWLDDVLENK